MVCAVRILGCLLVFLGVVCGSSAVLLHASDLSMVLESTLVGLVDDATLLPEVFKLSD